MMRRVGNRSWERLLEAEHEHGVAVVYRDRRDGSYWLSGSAEDGGSGMTEQRFTVEGLHDGWVQGGFLPQGATRALARDAQGAWSEADVLPGRVDSSGRWD